LRNYIGKDWFLEISLRQQPSALGKRIAELLEQPASEDKDKVTVNGLCRKS
jgi:cystathionine beta-synthase